MDGWGEYGADVGGSVLSCVAVERLCKANQQIRRGPVLKKIDTVRTYLLSSLQVLCTWYKVLEILPQVKTFLNCR